MPKIKNLNTIDMDGSARPTILLDTQSIGAKIKQTRISLRISQAKISQNNHVAINQAKYSMLEAGFWTPTINNLRHLRNIINALGMSFDDILLDSEQISSFDGIDIIETINNILDSSLEKTGAGVLISEPFAVIAKNSIQDLQARRSGYLSADDIIAKNIANVTHADNGDHHQDNQDSNVALPSTVIQQGGENSPGQNFSNIQNTYNMANSIAADEYSNMVADPQNMAFKPLSIFDIDNAVKYITGFAEEEALLSLTTRSTTFIPSDSRAYGIKVSTDLNGIYSTTIYKDDVLIVEPNIKPRQGFLVVVALNATNKDSIVGVVGSLHIHPLHGLSIQCSDIEEKIPLPQGSVICGVVTDIKRSVLDPSILKSCIDKDYDIWSTLKN